MSLLYPLKFDSILKSIIWGGDRITKFKNIQPQQDGIGESWEISGVKNNWSIVSNGELKGKSLQELVIEHKGELVGKSVYSKFGDIFPLLIKFIDAKQNLSIQVHPDDVLGKKRHDSFGKTEMWYVVDADKDAFLYSGFKKEMTPDQYVQSVADNTFVDYLSKENTKAGDVFFLPAGRVHAIGAGLFVAEIQQTSDITYRIYDYDRKDANGNGRELHTEMAKDAIDFKVYDNYKTNYTPQKDKSVLLESCPYFTTSLLDLDTEFSSDYSHLDSFVIYICIDGDCMLMDNDGNEISLRKGETALFPATTERVKITPKSTVKLIETFIK